MQALLKCIHRCPQFMPRVTGFLLSVCLLNVASGHAKPIVAKHCPGGRLFERGLCWHPCRYGYTRLNCKCRNKTSSYSLPDCGQPFVKCSVSSFSEPLPEVRSTAPFTMLFTSDDHFGQVEQSLLHERLKSVNNITGLIAWPTSVGGGCVQRPLAVGLLGDFTDNSKLPEWVAARRLYDPAFFFARSEGRRNYHVNYPTYLSLGNHDLHTRFAETIHMLRTIVSGQCLNASTFSGFPRENITSFDPSSLSYAFDVNDYHFIVLNWYDRRWHRETNTGPSHKYLEKELVKAQQNARKVVILIHDPWSYEFNSTFTTLMSSHHVVAIIGGHLHDPPFGYRLDIGGKPAFMCGYAGYRAVGLIAEFGNDYFRIGVVQSSDAGPVWFGESKYKILKDNVTRDVFVPNPLKYDQGYSSSGSSCSHQSRA